MKYSVYVAALITFVASFFCYTLLWSDSSKPGREQIANKITAKVAEKIEKDKGLRTIGTGGGMMYGIRKLSMSFQCLQEVDLETARKLVVYCTEEYLGAINSDKEVRPYLDDYPFTEKNVDIRVFFSKPDGHDVPIGKISVVSMINGRVDYEIDTLKRNRFVSLHEEAYQEALKIIQTGKGLDSE